MEIVAFFPFLFCIQYQEKKSRQNKGGVCYNEYLILPLICESTQSNTCNGYSVNLL